MVRNNSAGTSRKRSRGLALEIEPTAENNAPPFWHTRARLKRSHGLGAVEASRLGTSSAVSSLALIAHSRLVARDFAGASRCLSVLLARYRRTTKSPWHFPRECAAIGGTVLRRSMMQGSATASSFLEYVADDIKVDTKPLYGTGSQHVRAMALVEAALDDFAAGRVEKAHDLLLNQGRMPAFQNAFLVQLFLGLVALSIASTRGNDRDTLLGQAGEALDKAAKIDPTAYVTCHAAAAVEIQKNQGDVTQALERYRAFAGTMQQDAFAQSALLRALRSQPLPAHSRQEIVDAARALHRADPLACAALAALREAAAWNWNVSPRVDNLEVAAAAAAVVEHGAGNMKAWCNLAESLCECDERQRVSFWTGGGRDKWWPSHFFRVTRINADRQIDGFAEKKAQVALLLDAAIPYARILKPQLPDEEMC